MDTSFVGKNKSQDAFVCTLLLLISYLRHLFLTYNLATFRELALLSMDQKNIYTQLSIMSAHQWIRTYRLNSKLFVLLLKLFGYMTLVCWFIWCGRVWYLSNRLVYFGIDSLIKLKTIFFLFFFQGWPWRPLKKRRHTKRHNNQIIQS